MITYPRLAPGARSMISFAQNREDVLIERVLRSKGGFFIDVGAGHPVFDSVTKFFSIDGWRGINIEPEPEAFEVLRRDRPNEINLCCAIGRARGTATLYRPANRRMSTTSPGQLALLDAGERAQAQPLTVEMRTLADVCEQFVTGEIDFLSIDVEGAEGDVIAGADWRRFRPRLVVIEATRPWSSEPNCPWEPALLAQGYLFQHFDGINRYYLRREDEALAGQFAAPVNVLDAYVSHAEARLDAEVRRLRAENEALRRRVAAPTLLGATFALPPDR